VGCAHFVVDSCAGSTALADSAVLYKPTREVALQPVSRLAVRVVVEATGCTISDAGTRANCATIPGALQKFFKESNFFWNCGLLSSTQVKANLVLPQSRYPPVRKEVFDIHAPYFDSAQSGLPAWCFALLLCQEPTLVLRHLVCIAIGRLGVPDADLEIACKDHVNNYKLLVEVLFESCKVPSTFVSYASDLSTGASGKGAERYSTSVKYGAAGDCEDSAKLIQHFVEAFAAKSTSDDPVVTALGCIAQCYCACICLVAARSPQASRAYTGNTPSRADFENDTSIRKYDEYQSHMVCVCVPLHFVSAQAAGGLSTIGGHEEWEQHLPTLVLEGTNLKTCLSNSGLVPAWSRNNIKEATSSPHFVRFYKLGASDFYFYFMSFSCSRGLLFNNVPVFQAFFTTNVGGQERVGASFLDLFGKDKAISVRCTHENIPIEEVRAYVPETIQHLRTFTYAQPIVPYNLSNTKSGLEKELLVRRLQAVGTKTGVRFTVSDQLDTAKAYSEQLIVRSYDLGTPHLIELAKYIKSRKCTSALVVFEKVSTEMWGCRFELAFKA
jgi:hypothetical protein